ncbi:MAG: hypothetical protein M3481_08255 [Actinomycetota bacterium]|nr:hypothetical protein [Actinomycetota bacterium]
MGDHADAGRARHDRAQRRERLGVGRDQRLAAQRLPGQRCHHGDVAQARDDDPSNTQRTATRRSGRPIRRRWERFHQARVALDLIAFGCLAAAALEE